MFLEIIRVLFMEHTMLTTIIRNQWLASLIGIFFLCDILNKKDLYYRKCVTKWYFLGLVQNQQSIHEYRVIHSLMFLVDDLVQNMLVENLIELYCKINIDYNPSTYTKDHMVRSFSLIEILWFNHIRRDTVRSNEIRKF